MKINYSRPWLYPLQSEAIFDPARICCIEASTKAGKTVGCISWLIEQAMLAEKPGRNFWWVAPVSDQADIAFNRTMAALPRDMITVNRTLKSIVFPTGSVMRFKSGDRPDTLYGDDVWAAVVDEASRLKEQAWHAVRSTMTYTRGPMRLIGNVRGRKNWFYQLSRQAQQYMRDANMKGLPREGRELAWHRIVAHDAVSAGVLSSEEIEQARRTYPEHVFRELYMAVPSDDGGNPFGLAAIAGCVGVMSQREPRVWGWDLAKHVDWTVGIALDMHGHVCRFERFQMPWEETVTRIHMCTKHTPALIDSTGVGDPILERLQRQHGGENGNYEGYHFHPVSKQKLMEGLAMAIQSHAVSVPPGIITEELEQFEYVTLQNGIRYSAPDGYHDDCVCALALAVYHHSHAKAPMRFSSELIAAARRPPTRYPRNFTPRF